MIFVRDTHAVPRLVERTKISLTAGGFADQPGIVVATSGAWLAGGKPVQLPPGGNYIGFGLKPGKERTRFLQRCGGDVSRLPFWHRSFRELPPIIYFAPEVAAELLSLTNGTVPNEATLRAFLQDRRRRVVHLPALDAHVDKRLRTVQVVTTIQIGGAERITLDLAAELNRLGSPTLVVATGKPTRAAFPAPSQFLDLSQERDRIASLIVAARQFGADVIHAHLLSGPEVKRLSAAGFKVVVTLHNTPNAWPAGMDQLTTSDAALLLGCAQAVTNAITLPAPRRTLWNGINPAPYQGCTSSWREKLNIPNDATVLLALANVRFQKRFDRLPAILNATQALLPQEVHLILTGQGTENLPLPERCHALGLQTDIAPILAASDVLIASSDHEGLSLAQLEALAAGKRVVATDVGGTREVPGIHLVPADATPEAFARAIQSSLTADAVSFPKSFTRHAMAKRAQWLYPRLFTPAPTKPSLLLVCNNFSVGGAQSSARRILTQLAAQGISVRAAVVEEEPRSPTAGRKALLAAGIPVIATPPPSRMDAAAACTLLLEEIDRQPPSVVIFWNLISSYKILLADALLNTPVFDVSPGEMLYSSLDRYFTQPRTGLPYLKPQDYGQRLAGVIVKYEREAALARETFGCPVHVIPNGITLFPPVEHPAEPKPFIFGTSARLNPDKKLEELVDAFRIALPQLPPCELRIAGGPDGGNKIYARSLRQRAQGLPVRWCGMVRDIPSFLAGCHAFVMISEPAGCPNASLEAMSSGLPIIATDHGGASDQVQNGINGYLTPRTDPAALAEKMVLIATNANLRKSMATASRSLAAGKFSVEQMVKRYREVLGL